MKHTNRKAPGMAVCALILPLILALASLTGCGGGKSALVGTWILIEGKGKNIPPKCELLRDGTGFALNQAITWKTEENRLYLTHPLLAMAFDYKIAGSKLNLSGDKGNLVYMNTSGGSSALVGTWTDIEGNGWVFNDNGELSYENGSKSNIKVYPYIVDGKKLIIHIESVLQTFTISVSADGKTAALTEGESFYPWHVAGPGWSENYLTRNGKEAGVSGAPEQSGGGDPNDFGYSETPTEISIRDYSDEASKTVTIPTQINNPGQSRGVCCSHKVLYSGFIPL